MLDVSGWTQTASDGFNSRAQEETSVPSGEGDKRWGH